LLSRFTELSTLLELPKAAGISIFDYLGDTLGETFLAPKTAGISNFFPGSADCLLFYYRPFTLSTSKIPDLRSNMAVIFLTSA
jgi:hypothetical protein